MPERLSSAFLSLGLDVAPPRPLGQHGRDFWDRVMAAYAIQDVGGIELLCLAAQSIDRAERCRVLIDRDGELTTTNGGVMRAHPLIREELHARAFTAKCIDRLGINKEAVKPMGRPPLASSWQPSDYDE
jgi:hypothetical protein